MLDALPVPEECWMKTNEQIYDVYRSAGFQDTNSATVAEGYSQLLPWLCEPSAPILDFGCGGGEFLEFIRGHGFTALHARAHCQARHRVVT